MIVKIIDWGRVQKGNDLELLGCYFAFLEVSEILTKNRGVKDAVAGLKLKDGEKEMVTEAGFREWLKSIVSIPYNDREMTKEQIASVNDMHDYLKTPFKQDEQPIVSGTTLTIDQVKEVYGVK